MAEDLRRRMAGIAPSARKKGSGESECKAVMSVCQAKISGLSRYRVANSKAYGCFLGIKFLQGSFTPGAKLNEKRGGAFGSSPSLFAGPRFFEALLSPSRRRAPSSL